MKKILFIYLYLFSLSLIAYCDTDDIIRQYAKQRVFDSITVAFKNFGGGKRFIQKFQLSEDEQKMIGNWGFDGVICKTPVRRKYGPGLTINFFPNKLFYIYKENIGNNQIKSIYGYWKVENKILKIKFIVKLIIADSAAENNSEKYRTEYLNNDSYYSIFTLEEYKIAYINKKAFDWGKIPLSIMNFFDFENNDAPRSKLLLDPLGNPPGDLQEGRNIGDILFYPDINNKEYLIKLLENTW